MPWSAPRKIFLGIPKERSMGPKLKEVIAGFTPQYPKRAINGPPTSNRGNQERSWRPQSQKSDQCSEKLEEVMAGDLR